ncbi:hypothetical protein Hdeb2414_s0025g00669011 [Helianthus debilis subsp. tardiflorus]
MVSIDIQVFYFQIVNRGYGASQMCKDRKTGCGSQPSHQSQYSGLS